ncbi:hypothetical protein [Cupriavidus metallidurans]|uniref:hypothetical protein n=1 Tax=Cupriavidus metallidurans TaxID=119219 RepID=UPI0005605580
MPRRQLLRSKPFTRNCLEAVDGSLDRRGLLRLLLNRWIDPASKIAPLAGFLQANDWIGAKR